MSLLASDITDNMTVCSTPCANNKGITKVTRYCSSVKGIHGYRLILFTKCYYYGKSFHVMTSPYYKKFRKFRLHILNRNNIMRYKILITVYSLHPIILVNHKVWPIVLLAGTWCIIYWRLQSYLHGETICLTSLDTHVNHTNVCSSMSKLIWLMLVELNSRKVHINAHRESVVIICPHCMFDATDVMIEMAQRAVICTRNTRLLH